MKRRQHVRTWDTQGIQGRWFGKAFPFYLSVREKKDTVAQENYWRIGLEMKIQFFYKREKQKYDIQIFQGALYIRELRTDMSS